MGYDLGIGEAKISYSSDRVSIDCEHVSLPDAPAFGEPTDHKNQRWPSYVGWEKAMKALGLMDVMFDVRNNGAGVFAWNGIKREPLIQECPGAVPVTQEHLWYIESKLATYKAAHPDHRAAYPPPKPGAKPLGGVGNCYRLCDYVDDPTCDGNLCRGEWLLFWIRWALKNCKQPVFVNS
jgi:hypothetical protein